MVACLASSEPTPFAELWPQVFETHHITKVELARLAWDLGKKGEIIVANAKPRERTMNDGHVLRKAKTQTALLARLDPALPRATARPTGVAARKKRKERPPA